MKTTTNTLPVGTTIGCNHYDCKFFTSCLIEPYEGETTRVRQYFTFENEEYVDEQRVIELAGSMEEIVDYFESIGIVSWDEVGIDTKQWYDFNDKTGGLELFVLIPEEEDDDDDEAYEGEEEEPEEVPVIPQCMSIGTASPYFWAELIEEAKLKMWDGKHYWTDVNGKQIPWHKVNMAGLEIFFLIQKAYHEAGMGYWEEGIDSIKKQVEYLEGKHPYKAEILKQHIKEVILTLRFGS